MISGGAFVAMLRRWPDVDAELVSWLRNCATAETTAVRGRIRHVLEGHALPQSKSRASELLDAAAYDLPPEGPFWPVELI